MSLISTAAATAVTSAATASAASRRARLQATFTDSAGKVLLDVSKLTTAHADMTTGLLVLTDGTVFLSVGKELHLVTRGADGEFTDRGAFTSLLDLGLLLADGPA